MLKRALLVGAGAVAGWYGARAFSKGRDAAAIKAEETIKTTLTPENIGKNIGSATATVAAESVKSFFGQLREEIPAWQQRPEPHRVTVNNDRFIDGEAQEATDTTH